MLSRNSKRRTEMKVFRVTVAGAWVLLAVTAGFAMSVKSDYEKNFDFTQLHTFAFKTDRAGNDPLSTNTLEAGRIQNALAAQLGSLKRPEVLTLSLPSTRAQHRRRESKA
jgi:hypothetical protein